MKSGITQKINLLFSDVSFGCEEYGFLPRPNRGKRSEDSESEDSLCQRYLRS